MSIEIALTTIAECKKNKAVSLDLKGLGIENNGLLSLKSELESLTGLTELNLSSNQISDLTPLKGLNGLTALYLSHNQISDLTPLAGMTGLTELYLTRNQISDLTPLKGLTGLTALYLTGNQISDLTPLKGLTGLSELYLEDNQVSDLTSLERLMGLIHLDLDGNQINDLIPLERLTELSALYLNRNRISDLTPLERLTGLNILWAHGNPALEKIIPGEILEDHANPSRIIDFFLDIRAAEGQGAEKDKPRPLNEVKIVVIGEAGIGKTCLIKRLLYGTYDAGEDRTHGVRIYRWDQKENGSPNHLNFWDFGGQEIMHSTHQFFFTTRTLYLIAVNSRQNEVQRQTEEWLQRIANLGGASPVLVVGTHLDQLPDETAAEHGLFDINRTGLKEKYPGIKGFFGVCNDPEKKKYDSLFEKFRKGFFEALAQMPELQEKILPSWHAVKENIAEMQASQTPFITFEDYTIRCRNNGITESDEQRSLLTLLHDIGLVNSMKNVPRLENTFVLNPRWVTKGIYAMIDNDDLRNADGKLTGELARKALNKLSKENPELPYSDDKMEYLFELLKEYQLAFADDEQKALMVPNTFPENRPADADEWDGEVLRFQYEYRTYVNDHIWRFIAKEHALLEGRNYWRTGCILRSGNVRALVAKSDKFDRTTEIAIKYGSEVERAEFLEKIRVAFDRIHGRFDSNDRYESIGVEEFVPNPDYPDVKRPFLRLQALYTQKGDAIEFIHERDLNITYEVRKWLQGIVVIKGYRTRPGQAVSHRADHNERFPSDDRKTESISLVKAASPDSRANLESLSIPDIRKLSIGARLDERSSVIASLIEFVAGAAVIAIAFYSTQEITRQWRDGDFEARSFIYLVPYIAGSGLVFFSIFRKQFSLEWLDAKLVSAIRSLLFSLKGEDLQEYLRIKTKLPSEKPEA